MEETKSNEKQFWKSKKWWAMSAAVSIPILNRILGLDMTYDELTLDITPLVGYILGQGVADIGKNKK